MCGINICVSTSSKKRLNSSLYLNHGDMLPSQFNVPHKTAFKCFDCATSFKNMQQNFWRAILFAGRAQNQSGLEFLMQAKCLSLQGAHNQLGFFSHFHWSNIQYNYQKQCRGDWISKTFVHSAMPTWLYV